jgi:DnaK suppressor protein
MAGKGTRAAVAKSASKKSTPKKTAKPATPAKPNSTSKAKASAPLKVVAKKKPAPLPPPAPTKSVKIVAKASPLKAVAPQAVKLKPHKAAPVEPIHNRGTPPTAVPTDGKPRKNVAGLNSRELEGFRDLLLAKRREIVGDMSSMEREALRSSGGSNLSNLPIHMADMGTDNYEQEFTLGLMEKDRKLLREINSALGKIQDGSYGICEGTGKPISKPRLEAQPWAKYSIEYARKLELNRLR